MKMSGGSQNRAQVMGSAFFITNEPSGNFVVSADIGANGQMSLVQAISTGGVGAHGLTDPVGPDPLFTQGAVKTSKTANVLITVNAGSNSLSAFTINPKAPSLLKTLGAPVSSEGEFPVSVAINAAGTSACTVNSGAVNGVSCYSINKRTGLTKIANTVRSLNLNQTTPATGPAGTASHIVFSENQKQLVVSVKGLPPTPGFLAVWDIAKDGSLSADFKAIAPTAGGLLPFSMTIIPGKNAILATDAGIGFSVYDFAAASVAGSGNATVSIAANATVAGGKSSNVAIKGQGATCWSSLSAKTGNFYLTDVATSTVTEVNVAANTLAGTIVAQYPQTAGSGTIDNDVLAVGATDFLYVLSANATAVDVLSLGAPGKAKHVQKLDIAGPAKAAGLTLNAVNLQGMTTFKV